MKLKEIYGITDEFLTGDEPIDLDDYVVKPKLGDKRQFVELDAISKFVNHAMIDVKNLYAQVSEYEQDVKVLIDEREDLQLQLSQAQQVIDGYSNLDNRAGNMSKLVDELELRVTEFADAHSLDKAKITDLSSQVETLVTERDNAIKDRDRIEDAHRQLELKVTDMTEKAQTLANEVEDFFIEMENQLGA